MSKTKTISAVCADRNVNNGYAIIELDCDSIKEFEDKIKDKGFILLTPPRIIKQKINIKI